MCEAYIQAKQSRKPYPKEAENRSKISRERIMLDVWGPTRIESIGKWRWYISFINDCAQNGNIKFMKTKGEAFDRIKEQVAKIEQKFGKAPRWIRINNGKEFVNKEIKKWVAEKGITIETTAPYSPSQNGGCRTLKLDFNRNGKGHDHRKGTAKIFMGQSHGTCKLSTHLITHPSSRITDTV